MSHCLCMRITIVIRFLDVTQHSHRQFLSLSILQQLQRDQAHTVTPDKNQFRSLSDAVQRLLSYHVCQGSMPTEEDLRKGEQAGAPERLLGTRPTGEPELVAPRWSLDYSFSPQTCHLPNLLGFPGHVENCDLFFSAFCEGIPKCLDILWASLRAVNAEHCLDSGCRWDGPGLGALHSDSGTVLGV